MSELHWEGERPLDRPVLVVAFAGPFDAASVATGACEHLVAHVDGVRLATIEPEGFFDFQRQRPMVTHDDAGARRITWPEVAAHAIPTPEGHRDLVVITGPEPHLRWATFVDLVLQVAEQVGAAMVVTLGASPAQAPHTRPPVVFGSSTNEELAGRLGLSRPQYQGLTGVLGVLQATLDTTPTPAIALRVEVPHYAMGEHDPKATMALLRHLEHVTGAPTSHGLLATKVARWEERLDAAVADDAEARVYVRQLEVRYDSRTEQQVSSSSDDLAAELERFLREQQGEG